MIRITLLALVLLATASTSDARPNALGASVVQVADTTDVPDVTVRTPSPGALDRFRNDEAYDYDRARSTGGPSMLEKFWAWIGQRLDDSVGAPVSGVLLRIFLVVFVAGALFFAIRFLLKMRRTSAFDSREHVPLDDGPITRDAMRTTDFDGQAEEALGAGDLRRAIRYRYLGLLQALIRADRIDWAPERTNLDYVDTLRGADGHEAFVRATDGFETVWYGDVTVSDETARRILDDIATARDQLTDLAPAA